MISCELCGQEFHQITAQHLKKCHGISVIKYRNLFPIALIFDKETAEKVSMGSRLREHIPDFSGTNNPMYGKRGRNNPNYGRKYNDKFCEKESNVRRRLWADPNSFYNTEQYRHIVSEAKKREHANPSSTYNTVEYHQKLSNRAWSGFGTKSYASDRHFCQSSWEYKFDEWLFKNGIEHEAHPIIPNNTRRADYLVGKYYIEVDGMRRSQEYWNRRYKNTEVKLIIINVYECDRNKNPDDFFSGKVGKLLCENQKV